MNILEKSQLICEPFDIKQSMDQYLLKAVQHSNADLIVIDDLSGLGLDGKDLSAFMYKLRSAAIESKTTIFIVLNIDDKPKRMDKRLMLSDPIINELHKFADVVQFTYWDDFDNDPNNNDTAKLEIILAKNYSSAKVYTIRLVQLLQYSAIVELSEENDNTFSSKYPGVIAGLALFAEYLGLI